MDSRLGALPSPYDVRDYKLDQYIVSCASNLPETFDLGIVKIKNQGSESTCVAFSLSEIIEYHHKQESGKYVEFSTEYIYGMRKPDGYQGEGMYLRDGLETIREFGDVTAKDLPGNHCAKLAINNVSKRADELKIIAEPNRITSYYRIESIQDLKYALYNHGPVSASMWWYDGCSLDRNNVYQFDESRGKGGHAIMIVGWTLNHIIVQNSWGTMWGNRGRFFVNMDDFFDLFFDVFGVTDDIAAVKKPSRLITRLSGIVNKIGRSIFN